MDVFTQTILIILGVSSVITVLEVTGLIEFIPKLGKAVRKVKVKTTLDLLKEMGLQIDKAQAAHLAMDMPRPTGDSKTDIENLINRNKIDAEVEVGKVNSKVIKEFWDVMGATVSPNYAEAFARRLSSRWKEAVVNQETSQPKFDFVVTPKDGSPILGYEFAKLHEVPLVLSCGDKKFNCNDGNHSFASLFDYSEKPVEGSVALLVDDSSTGGRKMKKAIDSLRKHGYKVSDCLIVFEPTIKTPRPRALFQNNNVKLHSIIEKN